MAYTVKKLSEISGVTVRALHYYEEIGLLKPAYYGSNGYRYYEENELLQLQQILFFKQLGFTLKKIQKVFARKEFDKVAVLNSHRHDLCSERVKIGKLIKTIDNTINHLQGIKKMKDEEMFEGLTIITKGKGDEPYFAQESLVLKNVKKDHGKTNEEVSKVGFEILNKLAACIDQGLTPSSDEVQLLIQEHYTYAGNFYVLNKEVYKALAILFAKHPGFKKQLNSVDLKLAKFMSKAMEIFAEAKL